MQICITIENVKAIQSDKTRLGYALLGVTFDRLHKQKL